MKDYKIKFIYSKFILGLCIFCVILIVAMIIGVTVASVLKEIYLFLISNVFLLAVLALILALLFKEVYVVKVYDDKITFKAFLQKEKVLNISEIKNVYKCYMPRMGELYFFGTRDIRIDALSISETEVSEREIFKFGYPFKFEVNDDTTAIVKEFLEKPIVEISTE